MIKVNGHTAGIKVVVNKELKKNLVYTLEAGGQWESFENPYPENNLIGFEVYDTTNDETIFMNILNESEIPTGSSAYYKTIGTFPVGEGMIRSVNIYKTGDDIYLSVNDTFSGFTVKAYTLQIDESGGGGGQLEYGSCCYIGSGTGIILPYTINADYKVTVSFYEEAYHNDAAVIGNTSNANYSHLTEYSNKWYTSSGTRETNFGSWVGQTEHTYINNNGNSKNEFDGVEVTNYTPTTNSNISYTIGCRGSATSNKYSEYIKSYKIESISTGDVICELKPAKFIYEGVAMKQGLLDVVNQVWYDNGTMVVSNAH